MRTEIITAIPLDMLLVLLCMKIMFFDIYKVKKRITNLHHSARKCSEAVLQRCS